MIQLKKRILSIVICMGLLACVTYYHFQEVEIYYNSINQPQDIMQENFENKLEEENGRAKREQLNVQEIESERNQNQVKAPSLHARGALLMDAETERVLFESDGYKKMPMASTTKIMTCIIALEQGNLDDIVTISSLAARQPDVQLNARTGEQYYLRDLLYALMLESLNDVAVAIAEHIGGSVEGFATLMNDKAISLGCNDTNFVTPSGLDAVNHYTTARDLAVIASYALKNEDFIKITNTASHQFQEIKNKRRFHVSNKNRFLYMMDGAIGMKTGFTNGAGYCFVGAVKKVDRTLVSVVLGCGWPPNKTLKWTDTKALMEYGIKNYEKKQIFRQDDLGSVEVIKGKEKSVPLEIMGDLNILMSPMDVVDIEYDLPTSLNAPVESNIIVGYAKYYINNQYFKEIPVYVSHGVDKIQFKDCFDQVLKLWGIKY